MSPWERALRPVRLVSYGLCWNQTGFTPFLVQRWASRLSHVLWSLGCQIGISYARTNYIRSVDLNMKVSLITKNWRLKANISRLSCHQITETPLLHQNTMHELFTQLRSKAGNWCFALTEKSCPRVQGWLQCACAPFAYISIDVLDLTDFYFPE